MGGEGSSVCTVGVEEKVVGTWELIVGLAMRTFLWKTR